MRERERFIPAVDVTEASDKLYGPEGGRRDFLKLMLSSMGAASLAACVKKPAEEIVPYVTSPEELVPGTPDYYSSVFARNGFGYGVVVESHQGRPTKVEGNPNHPASLGASDAFMQAEIFNLYDPDRSRAIEEKGLIRSRGEFELAMAMQRERWAESAGQGLHILTPLVNSPSLENQLAILLQRYPAARWHQWQPVNDDNALLGSRLAFGKDATVDYELENADLIVQLDGDLFTELPGSLHYARDFARRREPLKPMTRLYAIESTPGLAGAMADHRLAVNAAMVERLALFLVSQIAGDSVASERSSKAVSGLDPQCRRWLELCAADLQEHAGRSLVIAGRNQTPSVHAMAHWLNHALGNIDTTLVYREAVASRSEVMLDSLRNLVSAMAAGEVHSLLMIDCDPVFTAPADYNFGRHLQKVGFSAHIGLYFDKTAAQSCWHLPLRHALESWGDQRAYEGSIAIQQPLISPLHNSVSPLGLLSFISGEAWRSDYDVVRSFWRQRLQAGHFDEEWREILIAGLVPGTQSPRVNPSLDPALLARLPVPTAEEYPGIILQFACDPRLWDGSYANNDWLQELPQPLSTLTWGNALLMAPELAARHRVESGDVVAIQNAGKRIELPALILQGHAPDAVTVNLGHGRPIRAFDAGASTASRSGVDVYPLRDSRSLFFSTAATMEKAGGYVPLAIAQAQNSMAGRHPVRHASLESFRSDSALINNLAAAHPPSASLYEEPYPSAYRVQDYQWGMSIDLNACIGCGACSIACQAENNIPVVGPEQALLGRRMDWLRIDRYYLDEEEGSRTLFQPMLCHHCENAPCEYVCPVGATVHDSEGLNVMVYNRCIGTRDCSQNCPYKVRRFNFFDYNYDSPRSEQMAPLHNPDVSLRSRGVMEKCSYCLQRISETRRRAKKERRQIEDGELLTACQQSCPTQAIVFGNINDPESRVSKEKNHPLSYSVLADLNTRPRTTYHARIHNSNPELQPGRSDEGES